MRKFLISVLLLSIICRISGKSGKSFGNRLPAFTCKDNDPPQSNCKDRVQKLIDEGHVDDLKLFDCLRKYCCEKRSEIEDALAVNKNAIIPLVKQKGDSCASLFGMMGGYFG